VLSSGFAKPAPDLVAPAATSGAYLPDFSILPAGTQGGGETWAASSLRWMPGFGSGAGHVEQLANRHGAQKVIGGGEDGVDQGRGDGGTPGSPTSLGKVFAPVDMMWRLLMIGAPSIQATQKSSKLPCST